MKYKVYTGHNYKSIPQIKYLDADSLYALDIVSRILPFRVNNYVLDELIDWQNYATDPLFILTFPQQDMLPKVYFQQIARLLKNNASKTELAQQIYRIRMALNPHPSGQTEYNIPVFNDEYLAGIQHKYNETVLYFPKQGQTCHSYCTFCFRWAQFIGDKTLKFSADSEQVLVDYLKANTQVTDLLITGGDPLVMKTHHLQNLLERLLQPELAHITTIRIGSKALTYWPYRFLTDSDAPQLLELFSKLVQRGKHVAFMAHINHWRELSTEVVKQAVTKIKNTGVIIRSQAPILANINNSVDDWIKLWKKQVELGIVPYYVFVERDTGAKNYFELPLFEALTIYQSSIQNVSGLGRTARGPIMSATTGKIEILGRKTLAGVDCFILRYMQARIPSYVGKIFFAKFDGNATWFDHLEPAFSEDKHFFQNETIPDFSPNSNNSNVEVSV